MNSAPVTRFIFREMKIINREIPLCGKRTGSKKVYLWSDQLIKCGMRSYTYVSISEWSALCACSTMWFTSRCHVFKTLSSNCFSTKFECRINNSIEFSKQITGIVCKLPLRPTHSQNTHISVTSVTWCLSAPLTHFIMFLMIMLQCSLNFSTMILVDRLQLKEIQFDGRYFRECLTNIYITGSSAWNCAFIERTEKAFKQFISF